MKLFTHGGLQRDCMAIARRLMAQGHDVEIVCASATTQPDDLKITMLPSRAFTNHGLNKSFSRALRHFTAGKFDVVAGFHALAGLNVLYCANPPVRMRGLLDRINLRRTTFLNLEQACFGPQSRTHLLLLSEGQRQDYEQRWAIKPDRVTMIPPTTERARVIAKPDRASVRARLRSQFAIPEQAPVWLFVGSYPQTKGLDRIIDALPKFPAVRLLCVGGDKVALQPFRDQASQQGLGQRVTWLGSRDDVPSLMAASDLLVHPSRLDITGTVILEAIAHGLPVIATDVCGNAIHITASGAGRVLPSPFDPKIFIAALREADTPAREHWRTRGETYAHSTDLFSGLDVAAEAIVRVGENLACERAGALKMRR